MQEKPDGKPSRIRSAIDVLRGEALVPAQIAAEWAEYQLVFGELLQRLSAMLARQAKYEKQRAKRLADLAETAGTAQNPQAPAQPMTSRERKAELRRRAFGHAQPVPPAQPAPWAQNGETDE